MAQDVSAVAAALTKVCMSNLEENQRGLDTRYCGFWVDGDTVYIKKGSELLSFQKITAEGRWKIVLCVRNGGSTSTTKEQYRAGTDDIASLAAQLSNHTTRKKWVNNELTGTKPKRETATPRRAR